jgi:hypothetical protein
MHDLSERTKHLIDFGTFAFAGAAAVTLNQVAVGVTIVAGVVSIILGAIRIYDRMKFGRPGAG